MSIEKARKNLDEATQALASMAAWVLSGGDEQLPKEWEAYRAAADAYGLAIIQEARLALKAVQKKIRP